MWINDQDNDDYDVDDQDVGDNDDDDGDNEDTGGSKLYFETWLSRAALACW